MSYGESNKYNCTGPLCKKSEDLWPILKILSENRVRGDPLRVNFREIKVISLEGNGAFLMDIRQDLIDAQRKVVNHLESLGSIIRRDITKIENLEYSVDIWSSMISVGSEGGPSTWENIGKPNIFQELLNLLLYGDEGSVHTLPGLVFVLIETISKWFPDRNREYVEMGKKLKETIQQLLGNDTILIFPSYLTVAPEHFIPLFFPIGWILFGIFNVLELPSTQVPLGLNSEGLPLGVQIISNHGNDYLTIAVANELEKKFGGWIPPK